MAPPLNSNAPHAHRTFCLAVPDTDLRGEVVEIGSLHPGYRFLFYRSEAGSSWKQLVKYAQKHGYLIHEVSAGVDDSLTCDEFSAKWLRPSQTELRRDPLTDRKLAGWYDDEGYAFTQVAGVEHKPPLFKLTRTEREERAENDLALIRTTHAERTAKLAAELDNMADKRKRKRGRKTGN